jgi:hypothetical protein
LCQRVGSRQEKEAYFSGIISSVCSNSGTIIGLRGVLTKFLMMSDDFANDASFLPTHCTFLNFVLNEKQNLKGGK